MPARYPRRLFLLLILILACGLFANSSAFAVTFSQQFDLPIPSPDDAGSEYGWGKMDDAIIDVDRHISVSDLEVAVTLTHGSFFDLEIVLQSPAGTRVVLVPAGNNAFLIPGQGGYDSAGGSNRFLFDDSSATGIEEASSPFGRAFRPASGFKLSDFDGQDAFGQWRLQIQDVSQGDTGRLERVDLIISTPEPASALLFLFGAAWLGLSRRNRAG